MTHRTRHLSNVKAWIIDMDGVIYHDTEPIPGAAEFIRYLQEEGTPFTFLTNNSSLTPKQYADKLAGMDIEVHEANVLTSALATAAYLRRVAVDSAKVYVIGQDGIREAITSSGFQITEDYTEAQYVVVGLDRELCFSQLRDASLAIRQGAAFIGTNPDRTLPTPIGEIPGNGAILEFIRAATDTDPFVIGKPQPTIFTWALSVMGLEANEVACLGDRLETDILGGSRAGLTTVFVLCGVSTAEQLESFEPKPDFVYSGPEELLQAWRSR